MTVESMLHELKEWPLTARVIVTLIQGDKTPRRFEIDDLTCEPAEETGEIVIVESGEF